MSPVVGVSSVGPFARRLFGSTLARSSAVYAATMLISSAIPFLLMPVLTRYLTPQDYGTVAMVTVLIGIVSPFVGLNVHGAITVRAATHSSEALARYIGNSLLLLVGSTLIVSLFVWAFSGPISRVTAVPRTWLAAVVGIAFAQFIVLVLLAVWQARDEALRYGAFQVSQVILNVGLSLVLVVGLGMSWQGRVGAQTAAALVGAAVALWVLRFKGWARFTVDRDDLRHGIRFGVPLIPHVLGSMAITQTDRLFLTNMVSVAETGIYAVAFQLAMVIELIAISFNRAFAPWLFRQLAEDNPAMKRRIVSLTYVYFLSIFGASVALALALPWLLSFLVGDSFTGAATYTPWLAVGFAFSGMYYMVTNYIFFVGATHLLAVTTFLAGVLNVALNYFLIRANGGVGAAQASALSFLVMFVLTWALSARVYKMPWRLRARVSTAS